jgi:hypothetical protein
VTRATECLVEILAEAHRVLFPQILPAEAAGQFPQDAFKEEAVRRQRLARAVFPGRIKFDMQEDEGFLQEQPLEVGETARFPSQIRAAQIRVQII